MVVVMDITIEDVVSNKWYALSSFTYLICGKVLLIFFSDIYDIEPQIPIPIELTAFMLIAQSWLSYRGDVVYIHTEIYTDLYANYWIFAPKNIDICFVILHIIVFNINFFYITWQERIIYIISFAIAAFCFYKSFKALHSNKQRNLTQFLKWHVLWHLSLPIAFFVWIFYRKYLL